MPADVRLLPDEPIIMVTLTDPFENKDHIPELNTRLREILDAAKEPLWDVTDLTQMKPPPFGEVVSGTAMMTRGELASLKHPKIAGIAVVTTNDILRLATNALSQAQYGGVKTTMYKSLDEALAEVRKQIREKAGTPA